jgi:hypothetical protein
MVVLFHYRWSNKASSRGETQAQLMKVASVVDAPEALTYEFSKYLLSAITSDFPEQSKHLCDEALADIDRLERGDIDAAEWGGNCFLHVLTRAVVSFEHAVYGQSVTWPRWTCTLEQYKAALLGWRQFLSMPESIESQLAVKMPTRTA